MAAASSPSVAWKTTLATTYGPVDMVVDDTGRVYVTIDPETETAITPRTVVAIEPDGSIAFSHTFASAVSSLVLTRDGLRMRVFAIPPSLVSVARDGTVVDTVALPERQVGAFAVASDGSLYTSIVDFTNPDSVVKLTPQGVPVWTSPPVDTGFPGSISRIALSRDDKAVFATRVDSSAQATRLHELYPDGTEAWHTDLDGDFSFSGPAVALDGTLRIATTKATGANQASVTTLYSLDASGQVLWTSPVGDAQGPAGDQLAIGPDGTTVLRMFNDVYAYDATGAMRWMLPVYPNGPYDAVIDSTGTLLTTAGMPLDHVTAIDVAGGAQLWSVPTGSELWRLAMGPSGAVYGGQGSAVVRLAGP